MAKGKVSKPGNAKRMTDKREERLGKEKKMPKNVKKDQDRKDFVSKY